MYFLKTSANIALVLIFTFQICLYETKAFVVAAFNFAFIFWLYLHFVRVVVNEILTFTFVFQMCLRQTKAFVVFVSVFDSLSQENLRSLQAFVDIVFAYTSFFQARLFQTRTFIAVSLIFMQKHLLLKIKIFVSLLLLFSPHSASLCLLLIFRQSLYAQSFVSDLFLTNKSIELNEKLRIIYFFVAVMKFCYELKSFDIL